jgi:hypothetical protein
MILGLATASFTLLHVVLSLIGIAAGLAVVVGLCGGKSLHSLTEIFLASTLATCITGFLFHSVRIGPLHIVGAIGLAVLAMAALALYVYRLKGRWREIYVISAVLALYLNVFVGIVQAFEKLAFLHALAPTQSEPPFIAAQAGALILFAVIAVLGVKKFHPGV